MSDASSIPRLRDLLQGNLEDGAALDEVASLALGVHPDDDRDAYVCQVAIAFAKSGRWQEAEEMAGACDFIYDRAECLREIADRLLAAGETGRARRILDQAAAISAQASMEWQRAELLSRIASSVLAAGAPQRAGQLWREAISRAKRGEASTSPQDAIDSSSVLWEISSSLARAGKMHDAFEVARRIRNEWKRGRALSAIETMARGEG